MDRSVEFPHGLREGDIDISMHYLHSIKRRGFIKAKPNSLNSLQLAGLIERGRNKFLKGLFIALPISLIMWVLIILGFKRVIFSFLG